MDDHTRTEAQAAFAAEEYERAAALLKDWAERGDVEAQGFLGMVYFVRGLMNEAIHWLTKAADLGDGLAAHNLGTLYLACDPRQPEEAKKWYQLAYELGVEEKISSDPLWFRR